MFEFLKILIRTGNFFSLALNTDIMTLCTGIRVNTNYERIASWGGCLASQAVSHIGYKESTLGRNYSPLSCLHLALAYRYHFEWRGLDIMTPCTGIRVNNNYERIASKESSEPRTPTCLRDTPRAHCCSQRPNYSFITSEWVIKFNGLSRTADSEVHIVHISHVIIACTLKSLSPPT